MDRQVCLSNKKSCVGYKDGEMCCELGSNYDENDIKSMYIYHKDMLIQI